MKYLIGKECPDCVAPALMPDGTFHANFRFSEHIAGRFGILFFFPLDFNYISFTELLSLEKRLDKIAALDATLIALSSDSHLAHRVWQSMSVNDNGLGPVGFPMIADMTRHIARLFDVLVAEAMPEAATIVVDPDNKVIFQIRHDTSVGRNIDRVIEAIQTYKNPARAPTSPIEQIMLIEKNAAELKRLGYNIVAESIDTDLNHPQWNLLPRNAQGQPKLSFPLLAKEHDWPVHDGMTIAVREGLAVHSTGLLMPDGQLLFEYHADRQIPRDFTELLRIADAVKHHFATGEVIPWEKPGSDQTI